MLPETVTPALIPGQRERPIPREVAAALDLVDEARVSVLLDDLLRVPSITGTAAESDAQHLLAARLERLDADVDLWPLDLPALRAAPGFPGTEAARTEGWGLVGTWGGDDGPTLVLNGHMDVVPTGDPARWTSDPFRPVVRDGSVHARGACDMKGGLAAQVAALQSLSLAGVRLRGRVALQSVVGEEDGGLGSFATIARGHTGDLAVICEPTSTAIVPACAGALTFRLTVPGQSVHASVRTDGVDAIEKYVLVHHALRALEARRNRDPHPLMARYALPYPLSVGALRAGDWASSVPDLLVAEGRLGVALGEPVESARRELEDAVAQVCADDPWLARHPVRVEWPGGQFAPGRLPEGSPLPGLLARAHTDLHGTTPAVHGVPYGSDLRLLTAAGVPTVHYGPGDVRKAHAADESVPVAEVVQVARTLVLLAARVCGLR